METHSPLQKEGSIFGGILLVAGCCIGAGMLGLPVLSSLAGFAPSAVTFFVCWLFMVCTGLLLLEVNLWFGEDVSLITLAEKTLGKVGKWVSWGTYLFLFYSLMVAYVAASGSLVVDFIDQFTGYALSEWMGSLLFALLFGYLIYQGTQAVDHFNRFLMFGLIVTYIGLVILGGKHVQADRLYRQDWRAVSLVIPAAILSFGFHNLVPSLTTYFRSNLRSLKIVIVVGSAIPLLIYLIWEWLILGIVPLEGIGGFKDALDHGEMATQALKAAVGYSWVLDLAQAFAFFAIITSFLSVALSFVDFLADGLGIQKTHEGRIFLIGCVLVPPFIFALLYPTIFLVALTYAGGFGAVTLFGILPALMVWRGRYIQKLGLFPMIPGGRLSLVLIMAFAIWVMALQII